MVSMKRKAAMASTSASSACSPMRRASTSKQAKQAEKSTPTTTVLYIAAGSVKDILDMLENTTPSAEGPSVKIKDEDDDEIGPITPDRIANLYTGLHDISPADLMRAVLIMICREPPLRQVLEQDFCIDLAKLNPATVHELELFAFPNMRTRQLRKAIMAPKTVKKVKKEVKIEIKTENDQDMPETPVTSNNMSAASPMAFDTSNVKIEADFPDLSNVKEEMDLNYEKIDVDLSIVKMEPLSQGAEMPLLEIQDPPIQVKATQMTEVGGEQVMLIYDHEPLFGDVSADDITIRDERAQGAGNQSLENAPPKLEYAGPSQAPRTTQKKPPGRGPQATQKKPPGRGRKRRRRGRK